MVFTASESIVEQKTTKLLIDQLLDECLRSNGRRPIMVQFEPSSRSIWRHWKGTVFAETWKSCARSMLWSTIVYLLLQHYPATFKLAFAKFHVLWGQLLSVTTFTLTFFVNESYSVFRTCLSKCRILQGRLNDLIMALAGFAQRNDAVASSGDTDSTSQFTIQSKKILMVVSRYIRLFNILYFASLTRSHRPLLTPQGMRRMVGRGILTEKEYDLLKDAPNVPATQKHNAALMWVLRTVIEARKAGHIDGGFGFEQQTMAKIQEIRSVSSSMESVLRGRMPFSYAHIVQVLIDGVLWMYPIMALSEGMKLSFHLTLIGSAFLTCAYQGLFDLAKRFLDPFYNENFWNGEDALVVDTLIAETNAGSMRWMNCLEEMPISFQSFRSGKLDDHILPVEGFSKDDADTREAEQREKRRKEEQQLDELQLTTIKEEEDMIREYYEEKIVEELEAAQEELETTKKILNAPPGSDFVPGVDDVDIVDLSSDPSSSQLNDAEDLREASSNTKPKKKPKRDNTVPKTLGKFIDAVEGEYEEAKEILEETYILGMTEESNSAVSND